MQTIGVIGAGSWGTALAQCYAGAGHKVLIWAREEDVVKAINEKHENTVFLPDIKLHKDLRATTDISAVIKCDIILLVTPAQYLRATLQNIKDQIPEGKPLVICSKGIEIATGKLMSQVAAEDVPHAFISVLTGPTFAADIARDLPSAVTIAGKDKDRIKVLAEQLAARNLRPYVSDDLIGTQIGGAVKNVIAIAAGILEGQKLGESARAALITRGLAEMARLTSAMGGKKETLMGMCGIGDLMLTCNSMESRNFSFGVLIGQGKTMQEILLERRSVTEGVHTAEALMKMAHSYAVEMPIAEAVYQCLHDNSPVEDVIDAMLERPVRMETI